MLGLRITSATLLMCSVEIALFQNIKIYDLRAEISIDFKIFDKF